MAAGVDEPPFPHSKNTGDGASYKARIGPEQKSGAEGAPGEEASGGLVFGADNPVENVPFPGTMSRG